MAKVRTVGEKEGEVGSQLGKIRPTTPYSLRLRRCNKMDCSFELLYRISGNVAF